MSSLDIATYAVSAAGLIVTAIGIIIALLAIFGYKDILTRASDAAVREGLKKIDDLSPEIEKRILENINNQLGLMKFIDLNDEEKDG